MLSNADKKYNRTQKKLQKLVNAGTPEHKYLGRSCKIMADKKNNNDLVVIDMTSGAVLKQKYTKKFIGHVRSKAKRGNVNEGNVSGKV